MIKADEVTDDIEQSIFGEDTMKERIVTNVLLVNVFAVHTFPLHIAFLISGDCTGIGEVHIRNDIEGVIGKEVRRFQLIVLHLEVGIMNGYSFLGWRFEFDDHQRHAVDENDHITSDGIVSFDAPLIGDMKIIVGVVVIVNELHQFRSLFPIMHERHFHTILQILQEGLVGLNKRTVGRIEDAAHGFLDSLVRKCRIDTADSRLDHIHITGLTIVTSDIGTIDVVVLQFISK